MGEILDLSGCAFGSVDVSFLVTKISFIRQATTAYLHKNQYLAD